MANVAMSRTKITIEHTYKLSRNDWFCVDAFSRLVEFGGVFAPGSSADEFDLNLRKAIEGDRLRVFENDGPPPIDAFKNIPSPMLKKVLERLKPVSGRTEDFDKALSDILRDENVPPKEIDEIRSDVYQGEESILGFYEFAGNRIVLFSLGIALCSCRLGVSPDVLRSVVLVHELGHWFHKMVVGNWPIPSFSNSSKDLLECLAQWFAFEIFQVNTGILKRRSQNKKAYATAYADAFSKLNATQSAPYRAFRPFVQCTPADFLTALKTLRQLDGNADLPDFQSKLP